MLSAGSSIGLPRALERVGSSPAPCRGRPLWARFVFPPARSDALTPRRGRGSIARNPLSLGGSASRSCSGASEAAPRSAGVRRVAARFRFLRSSRDVLGGLERAWPRARRLV
ncbi:MAG: hypothetical protein BGO98_43660 [Myxococcales bacterium 68-20]|nr:MAG: hypothetical protein BGO98_43660 [Myxococcales bacterium 68-20]